MTRPATRPPITVLRLFPLLCLPILAVQIGHRPLARAASTSAAGSTLSAAENARIQAYINSLYSTSDVKHSFQTKAGETIDCVDYFATPAAKTLAALGAPLTIEQAPPIPAGFKNAVTSAPPTDDMALNGYPDSLGRPRTCPAGTAPILRTTVADIQGWGGLDSFLNRWQKHGAPPPTLECPTMQELSGYAHAVVNSTSNSPTNPSILAGLATWPIFNPALTQSGVPWSSPQSPPHSLIQTWLTAGCGFNFWLNGSHIQTNGCTSTNLAPCFQTLEVGTIAKVDTSGRQLPNPQLIVYSTSDGYNSANYFQPDDGSGGTPHYTNGQSLNYSLPSSSQWYSITTEWEITSTRWWLFVQITPGSSGYLGYFPVSLFHGTFKTAGSSFQAGGEVYEPAVTAAAGSQQQYQWLTRMGSGADPAAQLTAGATISLFKVLTSSGGGAVNTNYQLGQGTNSPDGSTVPADYALTSRSSGAPFNVGDQPHFFGANYQRDYGYQWWPAPDWAYGEYKGQCGLGAFLTGLSEAPSGQHQAVAVQCGPGGQGNIGYRACSPHPFHGVDNRGSAVDSPSDWDKYYNKAECNQTEIVTGVAQSTSNYLDSILCCPANVTHQSCTTQVFYSGNSSAWIYGTSPDWNWGYNKGQCPTGQYVAGVSTVAPQFPQNGYVGAPHAILCCSP